MRSATLISFAFFTLVAGLPLKHQQTAFDKDFIHSKPHFIARDVVSEPVFSSSSTSAVVPVTTSSSSTIAALNMTSSPPVSFATSSMTPSPSLTIASTPVSSSSSSGPPTTSTAPASSEGSRKYVFAHHMVGNTFPYTVNDWAADISLAHSNGIDGFALNIGSDDWQPARVADAYKAASQSGTDFKFFISFDMSILPCASPNDAATLRNYIATYAKHPNQLIYDGKVFASTFAGESCAFGQSSSAEGWSLQFTQHPDLTGENAVYFVPSFFCVSLSLVSSTLSSSQNTIQNALSRFIKSTDSDTQYINGLHAMSSNKSKRAYMATVSPWFFTHYSPETFNKNFIYYADSHLYPTRWENLISLRDKIDLVEIVTWNDYGESHYIGPIEGAQPNSQAWVDGFNHTGWLDMTSYYATAFKTGSFPAIKADKIYMWSRSHSRDANAPDPVGKPSNFELMEDALWAVAMTTSPATVTLSTSSDNTQSFNVPAGMTKLSIPISPGGTMHGIIQRNGQTVVDFQPAGFTFNGSPQTYNFNAFVAVSS
ncbi:hypothetical protein EW146_g5466 [Bondarzewia mesenterica]|uniref:Glycoside hydrolase family 71 protein n=1 Tax=Bondarzewia mesenterica TaxID=1095465 RepID=A0A4S4LX67_9AGAM|nr:hypothetical protein EW146_g5466 [Bondarzewia mesenterica]